MKSKVVAVDRRWRWPASPARRRRPIRRGRSPWSCRCRPAARSIPWSRGMIERCAPRSASRSWSRTSAAPAAPSGTARVARAAPDGYTISVGTWGTHVLNSGVYSPPFDLLNDLEPVALLANAPQWFVAKKDLARREPQGADRLAEGQSRQGHRPHRRRRQQLAHVRHLLSRTPPAPSSSSCRIAAARRRCRTWSPARSTSCATSRPEFAAAVRAGKIKPYAVIAKARWFAAPEVPTAEEAGMPGSTSSFWHGLWAPKGTPRDVIAKLNAAVRAALADPTVRSGIIDIGQEMPPREQQTPEALAALRRPRSTKWWPIIKAAEASRRK